MNTYKPRITQQPRDIILNILSPLIDMSNYQVFYFGSRATGNLREGSDRDIGIQGAKPLPRDLLHRLQCKFDECPLLIDIVDFSVLDTPFKKSAIQHRSAL